MTLEYEKPLELSYPSFSIIIEWENLRFADMRITQKMLKKTAKQITEIFQNQFIHPEIIIAYNKEITADYDIEQLVKDALQNCLSLIDLKIIPTPDLNYYEQKNFAADYCSNEILILVDSDVIPDDRWLMSLLKPFSDPNVSVVGGTDYMDAVTPFEKGYNLFWIMPPKKDLEGKTAQLTPLLPNNVAYRREVFLQNKYPSTPAFRGATVDHYYLIKNKGYKIISSNARVCHGTTNGLKHIAVRALSEGHDKFLAWRGSHDKYKGDSAEKRTISKFFREKYSMYKERKKYLEMSYKDHVGVFCFGSIFLAFGLIGFLLTAIDSRLITKIIRI